MKSPLILRFVAFALDYTIVGSVGWLYSFCFGSSTGQGLLEYEVTGPIGLGLPLIWFSVLVVPEWLYGATAGKNLVGLRVSQIDGSQLSLPCATLRRISDVVDFWASGCIVAFMFRSETKRGQRLGDVLSRSVVFVRQ